MHRALIGTVVAGQRIHEVDDHRFGHARHIDFPVREERRRVPVFLEDGAVLGDLAVADVFPRIVAVKNHLHGVVVRCEGVDHSQPVGVEDGFDLRGPQPQLQCGDGVCGGLFGADEGFLGLFGFVPVSRKFPGGVFGDDETAERVDQRRLPGRHGQERIGNGGFAVFRGGLHARIFRFAGRRGEDQREGRKCQQVFFHSLLLLSDQFFGRFQRLVKFFAEAADERLPKGFVDWDA